MSNPFFYLTGDATKTPVDPYTLASGTKVTLANFSNRTPSKTFDTVIPRSWPPGPDAFVYAEGDVTKTPVDLDSQQAGTKLVLVFDGKETPVVAGNLRLKPKQNVELYVNILKEMMNSFSDK